MLRKAAEVVTIGKAQAVEISEGARRAARLLDAIGDTQSGNEREDNLEIELAAHSYAYYLCRVIRRVVQRWSNRPMSFWDQYDVWEELVEEAVLKDVITAKFSAGNTWKHIDAAGQLDIPAVIIDDTWDWAIATWRIKGSEAELTAIHERIIHIMS